MDKPKILMCSDDIRIPSGVGTMARIIIERTKDQFDWVNLGGAISHPANHTVQIHKETGIKIYAEEGYGSKAGLREIMKLEKPDALFLFTDPKYFGGQFAMEYELRQQIPYIFYTIWDNYPYPKYNKPFYESSDGLLCISSQTKDIVGTVLGDDKDDKIIEWCPHGIEEDVFYKVRQQDIPKSFINKTFKGFDPYGFDRNFLWINTNQSRKRPADIMLAFDRYLTQLKKDGSDLDSISLIMHTKPISERGNNLYEVRRDNCNYPDNIYLSHHYHIPREEMRYLYAIGDVLINNSDAEGWGLTITEAMMTETPVIGTWTGGMKDQLDEKFAKILYPNSQNIIGMGNTPYIYEDRVDIDQLIEALAYMNELSEEELDKMGEGGRELALVNGYTADKMVEKIVDGINKTLENFKPRKTFTASKV